MTTYSSLPQLHTLVGNFKFTLYSEFAGLTEPTIQTVVGIGDMMETADIDVGTHQLSALRITLRDDYSTYNHGFWFKVFSGETWLRIYLDQGGGDTFYFFGIVKSDAVQWSETYIGTTRIRTVTIELVSMGLKLMDTVTEDWAADVMTNSVDFQIVIPVLDAPRWGIKLTGLFAAMLKSSGLNGTYDITDVSFVSGSDKDFKFLVGAAEYNLSELYVITKYYDGVDDNDTQFFQFNGTLAANFAKLSALLSNLMTNCGIIMRMGYNTSTERHTIELIQRGRAYSSTLDFEGREKASTIKKSSDLLGDAVICRRFDAEGNFVWFSQKYSDSVAMIGEPGNFVEFDADTRCIFTATGTGTPGGGVRDFHYWSETPGAAPSPIDGIKYRNYFDDTDVTASVSGKKMEEAIAGYLFFRFTNEYTSFVRSYSEFMGATGTDHTVLNILRRTSINDGIAAADYYANSVRKIPDKSEVEIEWILE